MREEFEARNVHGTKTKRMEDIKADTQIKTLADEIDREGNGGQTGLNAEVEKRLA